MDQVATRSIQIRDRKSIYLERAVSLQASSACLIPQTAGRAGRDVSTRWPSIDNRGRPSVGPDRAATLRASDSSHSLAGRRCSNLCVCIRSIRHGRFMPLPGRYRPSERAVGLGGACPARPARDIFDLWRRAFFPSHLIGPLVTQKWRA